MGLSEVQVSQDDRQDDNKLKDAHNTNAGTSKRRRSRRKVRAETARISGNGHPTVDDAKNTGQGAKRKMSKHRGKRGGGHNQGGAERQREAKKRAKERFQINPKPLGFESYDGPAPISHDIEWDISPVKVHTEKEVSDLVMIRGEWGFLGDEMVDKIARRIAPFGINIQQGLSLRKAQMQEKAVYGHHRMMARGDKFKQLYENGESILNLSKRFDFPPVAIFRAILTSRGWSKLRIKEALRSPKKRLSERDQREFASAEEKDRVTNVDQGETALLADLFEVVLGNYLDDLGINYRRQDELLKEQQKEHGRPLNTPDFLIMDRLVINGQEVAWIDAKNFYGANVSFAKKKTKKQMNRYIDEWGAGAIVYRHGFCKGVVIPGVLMLDSTPLDLTLMERENDN